MPQEGHAPLAERPPRDCPEGLNAFNASVFGVGLPAAANLPQCLQRALIRLEQAAILGIVERASA
jgi:hypothetical protein